MASRSASAPAWRDGVPGSGTTAVLLAMLISLNITPGALLFKDQPDVVETECATASLIH